MSKESINKFILDVNERPELSNILEKSKKKFSSNEERFEYVAKEAKKYGYDFTAADMILAMGEHNNSLLDDDLANVAGGGVVRDGANYVADKAKKFWKWLTTI